MQRTAQIALMGLVATGFSGLIEAQQSAFGLDHTPLGQAQLQQQGGTLTVSNLGSSGCDGVSIDLGDTDYHTVQFDAPSAIQLPDGSETIITTEGVLAGQPDRDIWSLRVLDVGQEFAVSLDTSLVQSGTLRVDALLGGVVVDTQSYSPAPSPNQILAVFQPEGCLVDPFWPMGDETWAMIGLANPGPMTLPGSNPVIADTLVLASSNQVLDVGTLSGTRMMSDMGSFVIHQETIGLFGLPHQILGQAQFEPGGNRLKVSNLGSSGCDGVSIDLGGASTHQIDFDPQLPASQLTDGTFMDFQTFGQLSGVPDQDIWTLRLLDIGNEFGASLDTTHVQPGGLRVDILSNGSVVDTQLLIPPPLPGDILVSYPPLGCRTNPFLPVPVLGECWALIQMDGQVPMQIPGQPQVLGDTIRLASFNQAQSVDSLSQTQIRAGGPAGGIDSFEILAQSTDPDPGLLNIYCTSKLSSAGCSNVIGTSNLFAQPVSGANDYQVTCSNVQGFKNGLLIASISGPAAIPFVGGTLCINPPLKRGTLMNSGGTTPFTCDGSYATTVNSGLVIPFGLDAGPGNSAWYQYWYRDPQDAFGSALSNALQLDF